MVAAISATDAAHVEYYCETEVEEESTSFWQHAAGATAFRVLLSAAGLDSYLESRIEVGTPVAAAIRYREGAQLLRLGMSPYTGSAFHGPPLLLAAVHSLDGLLSSLFPVSPDMLAALYLWSPLAMMSSLGGSPAGLENAAVFGSLAAAASGDAALAALGLASATYLGLHPLLLGVSIAMLLWRGAEPLHLQPPHVPAAQQPQCESPSEQQQCESLSEQQQCKSAADRSRLFKLRQLEDTESDSAVSTPVSTPVAKRAAESDGTIDDPISRKGSEPAAQKQVRPTLQLPASSATSSEFAFHRTYSDAFGSPLEIASPSGSPGAEPFSSRARKDAMSSDAADSATSTPAQQLSAEAKAARLAFQQQFKARWRHGGTRLAASFVGWLLLWASVLVLLSDFALRRFPEHRCNSLLRFLPWGFNSGDCISGSCSLGPSTAGHWAAETYGFMLTVRDLTPNIGLHWYFFAGIFAPFRAFWHFVFNACAAAAVVPLAIRIAHRPLLLALAQSITNALLKPYPSVGDVAQYLALLPLFGVQLQGGAFPAAFLASTFVLLAGLGPAMWHMWIYLGSANSNFFYAITLLFGAWQAVLAVAVISSTLRFDRRLAGKSLAHW